MATIEELTKENTQLIYENNAFVRSLRAFEKRMDALEDEVSRLCKSNAILIKDNENFKSEVSRLTKNNDTLYIAVAEHKEMCKNQFQSIQELKDAIAVLQTQIVKH